MMFENIVIQWKATCNQNMSVHKTFWLTKESWKTPCQRLLVSNLSQPKYTHSSHMLKQQGLQISVQQKNQKAKLQVYSLLLLIDLSFCPRLPPALTLWPHLLTARLSPPCIPQGTPSACSWLLSQNHPMPTVSYTTYLSKTLLFS